MAKLLSIVAAGALLAACTSTTPRNTVSPAAVVQKLGYDTVALPSTAYGPGALVTSVRGAGLSSPLKLTYLCRPDFTNTPPPIVDAAASSQASSAFGGTFALDAPSLSALGIGAQAQFLDSVTLEFSNVKIEQLGFDDLKLVRDNLGPVCKDIVNDFSTRSLAYQTKQAIKADVTYTAKFKAGASAEVKNIVLDALNVGFGGSVQGSSGETVSGTGLYYGLILERV